MSFAFQSFAIVPAAGKSARMGTSKLLLSWQGRTLIQHLLAAWQQSDVTRIVVVARANDDRLVKTLHDYDVDVVLPAQPLPHMKDSVQAALVHIQDRYQPSPHDAWLLAPADLPRLSPRVVNQLLAAYEASPAPVLVPCHGGHRGHPVLFGWAQYSAVFELPPDQGVNVLLQRLPVTELASAEPDSWSDIDLPQDYLRLQASPGATPVDDSMTDRITHRDESHRPESAADGELDGPMSDGFLQ